VNATCKQPLRLAVFASGGGRSLANLLERACEGRLAATIDLVVLSRADAVAGQIARAAGVATLVVPPEGPRESWSGTIFAACRERAIDLVVLAGFVHLLAIPEDFTGRVINIHPSLLPAFGGRGFHGIHVHRAVIARGCTISGCTVHLVDDEYDHGRVLLQKAVPVLPDDTPESLAARVFAAECETLPQAISALAIRPLPPDAAEGR
jgi:phosphoribosylglycinamide formyltransferase 1